jgi:hypothetical protein
LNEYLLFAGRFGQIERAETLAGENLEIREQQAEQLRIQDAQFI